MFEVDHPATQAVKRARCDACDLPLHPVVYVPVDFEKDDFLDALEDADFRLDQPTLFVWEGVTNYLTSVAVDATLAAIRRAAQGTLVLTYVHAGALDGTTYFPESRHGAGDPCDARCDRSRRSHWIRIPRSKRLRNTII